MRERQSEAERRAEIDQIKGRLALDDVVAALVPGIQFRRAGRELVALSPFKAERTPSFYVDPRKGSWYCFASGQGGDVLTFAERMLGNDFPAALDWCRSRAGLAPATVAGPAKVAASIVAPSRAELEAEDRAAKAAKVADADAIWRQTLPGPGSLVETYLRARGVDCDALARLYGSSVPPSLRFHPALRYRWDGVDHVGPAMVGLVVDRRGAPTGIHRTWLAADGSGKARLPKPKLTLGMIFGSAGWLTPKSRVAVSGEGYETTLSVAGALAAAGLRVFALSAISLGNLAGAGVGRGFPHPDRPGAALPSVRPDRERPGLVLPAEVAEITLLEDADGKDPRSTAALMARALAKFRRGRIAARVASPDRGQDFNDMARVA